jgi:hypothetical protein
MTRLLNRLRWLFCGPGISQVMRTVPRVPGPEYDRRRAIVGNIERSVSRCRDELGTLRSIAELGILSMELHPII